MVKNLPPLPEMGVQSLGWEYHLEKEMATHFGILSWEIQTLLFLQGASLVAKTIKSPPTVGALGSIPELGRSPGGGHGNLASILAWRIPMDRGAWWAAVHGVAKSWT